MRELSEIDIRTSFMNCSKGEAFRIMVPVGLEHLDWERRDYLGWQDPKAPQRAYLVTWRGDEPVGIVLRRADPVASRARFQMCSLCRTPQPADNVALFVAPRSGDAGRNGNTIGTYLCAGLNCSAHVRVEPPVSEVLPDPSVVVASKIEGLVSRLDGFLSKVDSV
jgi:hypothetical protein